MSQWCLGTGKSFSFQENKRIKTNIFYKKTMQIWGNIGKTNLSQGNLGEGPIEVPLSGTSFSYRPFIIADV